MSLTSPLVGDIHAETAGLVIRRPEGSEIASIGGWNLRAYSDAKTELTAATPVSLILLNQGDRLLLFNAGEVAAPLTIKRPFARSFTLPPGTWTSISEKADSPVTAPVLFKPLEKAASGLSYDDYLKNSPGQTSDAPPSPIRIEAKSMTLPSGAVKLAKTGSSGDVLARWDSVGTVASAHVDAKKAGWYRLKMRYCSGDEPLRSILINGKAPFAEGELFSLPSTIGAPPSDGWSNGSDDWHEITLGADQVPSGWKFYLPQGPSDLALRNDGGGLNIDWLELEPAW